MFWEKDFHYLKGKHIGESLRDVNDTAESCIKLIQDFSDNKRQKTKKKYYPQGDRPAQPGHATALSTICMSKKVSV